MFPKYFCLKYFFICRFNPPRAQPDNREETQQGGETESCMAVLNNFYGDGATRIFSKIFKYFTKIFQASNGTMLLATTRSRSSARMWRATSPSPGRPSPTSGSPKSSGPQSPPNPSVRPFFEHTNFESPSEQTNLTQHALPFKCTVLFSKLDSTHRGPVQNLETDGRREKSDTLRICNGLWIRNLEYFSKVDRVCAACTERAKLN